MAQAQTQPTSTFIRPSDRVVILDACAAIREACARVKERPPEKTKKNKAA